jgi:purine-nucleoside phosphorylase
VAAPALRRAAEPYDKGYVRLLQQQAQQLGIGSALRTGTYAAVSGPTYETPAETRMLRAIGADAVGMSTVPEVIAARHLGVRVAAVSCITNLACGISHEGDDSVAKVTHEEVMENINLGVTKLKALLVAALPAMQQQQAAAGAATQ